MGGRGDIKTSVQEEVRDDEKIDVKGVQVALEVEGKEYEAVRDVQGYGEVGVDGEQVYADGRHLGWCLPVCRMECVEWMAEGCRITEGGC